MTDENTTGGPPQRDLRFWHGLLAVGFAIGIMAVSMVLFGVLYALKVDLLSWPMVLVQIVVNQGIFVFASLWIMRRQGIPMWQGIDFRPASAVGILFTAVGVLAAGVLSDQLGMFLHGLNPDLFATSHMHDMAKMVQGAPLGGFVLLAVFIAVGPAFGEEFLFRGAVFKSFRGDMPVYFAAIYSSILFGLVHMDWLQGISAVVIGLFFAYSVWATGSIVPGMVGHALNNFIWAVWIRTEPAGIEDVYQEGHSLPMVLICAALTVLSAILLFVFRKRDYSS